MMRAHRPHPQTCSRRGIVVGSRESRSCSRLRWRVILLGSVLQLCASVSAQGAGGYDPGLMMSWACAASASERGPIDISDPDPERELASHGAPADALGPPTENSTQSRSRSTPAA